MNTGGFDYSSLAFSGVARSGADRFAALMPGGARSGKLNLLLHLLANLPRSILLLGPQGVGKTTLLRQAQAHAQENWSVCYLAATANLGLERIFEELLQVLRRPAPSPAKASLENELVEQLDLLPRSNRKLVLLLDDAGVLMPGLLGGLCQFARLHPQMKLAFSLRPEDLPQKAASDALALADAHFVELTPADAEVSAPPPQPVRPSRPRPPEVGPAKAFRFVLRHREGMGPRPVAWIALTVLAAATATGLVVGLLWHGVSPPAGGTAVVPTGSQPPLASAPPVEGANEHALAPLPTETAVAEPAVSPVASPTAASSSEAAATPIAQAMESTSLETSPAILPASTAQPSVAPEPKPPEAEPVRPQTSEAAPRGKTPSPAPQASEEKPFAEQISGATFSREAAFARLLALWGVAPASVGGDECAHAKNNGLRCLSVPADWKQLQILNRPALLEFITPGHAKRYAVLTGIDDEKAVIEFNGQTYRPAVTEIPPLLHGEALILWKPPLNDASIGIGDRGETVRWIRQRLNTPASAGADLVFDQKLKARVMTFQRDKGLPPDGHVGALTMLHLELLADSPEAPKLQDNH